MTRRAAMNDANSALGLKAGKLGDASIVYAVRWGAESPDTYRVAVATIREMALYFRQNSRAKPEALFASVLLHASFIMFSRGSQ